MAAPAPSWGTIRVYGTWRNLDDGRLKAGHATFTYPVRVVNVTDDVMIPAGTIGRDLQTNNNSDNPSLDVLIPATGDTDNDPSTFPVALDVTFTDGSPAEHFVLTPTLTGGEIDLATQEQTVVIPDAPARFVVVVIHGSDPNVARPVGAAVVAWCGDAEPVHATGYDFRIPTA